MCRTTSGRGMPAAESALDSAITSSKLQSTPKCITGANTVYIIVAVVSRLTLPHS